jgi:hypothetical protein
LNVFQGALFSDLKNSLGELVSNKVVGLNQRITLTC